VAVTLSAGCALYLIGEIAFRRVLHLGKVAGHLVAAVACLVVAVVGVTVNGAIQLLALGVVLLGLLLSRWSGSAGEPERADAAAA
jgi:low temperature requirement protein LtrA